MTTSENIDTLSGQLVLDKYRILRPLAKGGMGFVYLGRVEGAAGFFRPVIVKRLNHNQTFEGDYLPMFEREARINARLHHPNIVSIIDFREVDGDYLMVLEYVHGIDLARWHKFIRRVLRRKFPVEFAIHIVSILLDALHYAHTMVDAEGQSMCIVHRDVSPANVMVSAKGDIKLTDFGIARMLGEHEEYRTQDQLVKGKFSYLPPELLHSAAPSPQSDVYACGVILHELLTGHHELRGPDTATTVTRALHHVLTPPTQLRPEAPAPLDAIVARATDKDASRRYVSADDFATELRTARETSADETQKALHELVEAHFFHRAMVELLGDRDLKSLEQTWEAPTPKYEPSASQEVPLDDLTDGPSDSSAPVDLVPLHQPEIPPADPAPSGRSRLHLPLLIPLLVGSSVGGIIGYAAWQGHLSKPPPPLVVVRGSVSQDGPTMLDANPLDAGPSVPDAGVNPVDAGVSRPAKKRIRPRPPPSQATILTRTFRRRRKSIDRCLNAHPSTIGQKERVEFRITVSPQGRVQQGLCSPKRSLKPRSESACSRWPAKLDSSPSRLRSRFESRFGSVVTDPHSA